MKQTQSAGYVAGLVQRSKTKNVRMFLVVDKPNHLAYTQAPSKSDRILAEAYPGGRLNIIDRSFKEMYEGKK